MTDVITRPLTRWVVRARTETALLDQLLTNRGVVRAGRHRFLEPDFDRDFHKPRQLRGMDSAVAAIKKALESPQPIGVFADYDADGVPAAALLHRAFRRLGKPVVTYIPSRNEGYGLSEQGLASLQASGAKLIVCVDLGVTGKRAAAAAKKMGLELIIVDHHLVQAGKLPTGVVSIINPKQKSDKYPFKDLSACGLAYKLLWALEQQGVEFGHNQLKWLIDLVGLSTIADMVPLLGENRLLAKYGLHVLNRTRNPGLKALMAEASLKRPIMAYQVSFMIAPRINAPGRMEGPRQAYELLIEDDPERAAKLADEIERHNRERQAAVERALAQALAQIEAEGLDLHHVLVLGGDWLPGIWGLVAAKLVERYHRPALVYGKNGETFKGSGRSIPDFHLVESLERVKHCLEDFGGHAQACGFSFRPENETAFAQAMRKLAKARLTSKQLTGTLEIEAELDLSQINPELVEGLQQFEPHGSGNPRAVFMTRGVTLTNVRVVGNSGRHLKAKADNLEVIGFGLGERLDEVEGSLDLVYTLEKNSWNGETRTQLKLLDFRPASG